jgi:hypothetical protein
MIQVISLGAGVQSSTLAEMAAAGAIKPMPDFAIFADTGNEPKAVYRWLDWLEKRLPFKVLRVKRGTATLGETELRVRVSKKTGKRYSMNKIPMFVKKSDGTVGLLPRKCTLDFKITPIKRAERQAAGIYRKRCDSVKVIQWIGISTDEIERMKTSKDPWIQNRYPLIDEFKMSRKDCESYWEERGLPKPPRSACNFCPYHNDQEWYRMKMDEPEEFQEAVAFEIKAQAAMAQSEVADGVPYLHESCKPLDTIDFETLAKLERARLNKFKNQCAAVGMCGH